MSQIARADMITKEEYLQLAAEKLEHVYETIKKKNNDYTAGTDDPFNNFRLSTLEGVRPEVGVMIRTQDKFQRIRTYLNAGELKVEGETVYEAVTDVIGYMLLLEGLIKEAEQDAQ